MKLTPSTNRAAAWQGRSSAYEEPLAKPRALYARLAISALSLAAGFICNLGLLLLFYFIITPVALWRRIVGRDSLNLKFDPKLDTYRIDKAAARQSNSTLQDSTAHKLTLSLKPGKRWLFPILGLLSWFARKQHRRRAEQPMTIYTMF